MRGYRFRSRAEEAGVASPSYTATREKSRHLIDENRQLVRKSRNSSAGPSAWRIPRRQPGTALEMTRAVSGGARQIRLPSRKAFSLRLRLG